jgi:hypothetical protein
MKYSLEKISTVQACDTLLASAQKKKQTLEIKRRNLGESIDTFRKRLDHLGNETIEVQLLLAAHTTAYHALAEGSKYKASINVKVKRLELRQARLDKKAYTCNLPALLAKELKYNKLDNQVAAIDSYIALVQNKRMALGHAAPGIGIAATFLPSPAVHQKSQSEKEMDNTPPYFTHPIVKVAERLMSKNGRSLRVARAFLSQTVSNPSIAQPIKI